MILSSCGSVNQMVSQNPLENYPDPYIVVPYSTEQDSVQSEVYMIRHRPPRSAWDSQAMAYTQFGKWNKTYTGIYHKAIPQMVWFNVKLDPQSNATYTIIASGTETMEAYFCTLMIFDSKDMDCLNPDHPKRDLVIRWANEKMNDTIELDAFLKTYRN
ncbi:MAG: hypothetical protein KJP09_08745 [Bacteroidia bacterium]|nr:hypothetical protein [Bacteroidia bacterium]NND09689.1 hypothetical protein [Flavobacteriaceae bacterium]